MVLEYKVLSHRFLSPWFRCLHSSLWTGTCFTDGGTATLPWDGDGCLDFELGECLRGVGVFRQKGQPVSFLSQQW